MNRAVWIARIVGLIVLLLCALILLRLHSRLVSLNERTTVSEATQKWPDFASPAS